MPQKTGSGGAEGFLASHAIAVAWFGMFCTSTSAIFVRYSTAPSLVLAAYRKGFTTLLLLVPLLMNREYRKELVSLPKKTYLWCLLSGLFLALHFWTYFLSVVNTTIAASQVLVNTEVLFVAAFLFLMGKERFSRLSVLGIVLALAGGILVAYTKGGMSGSGMIGNLQALFAASMIAAYSLIGRKVRAECSTTVYTFLVYGTSAVILLALIPVCGYSFTGYGAVNYATALGMAVVCSLLGHSVFNWTLKYLSPTVVSLTKIFQPVVTVIWALLLFREVPVWNQLVGGVIVIAGFFLYIRNKEPEQA